MPINFWVGNFHQTLDKCLEAHIQAYVMVPENIFATARVTDILDFIDITGVQSRQGVSNEGKEKLGSELGGYVFQVAMDGILISIISDHFFAHLGSVFTRGLQANMPG